MIKANLDDIEKRLIERLGAVAARSGDHIYLGNNASADICREANKEAGGTSFDIKALVPEVIADIEDWIIYPDPHIVEILTKQQPDWFVRPNWIHIPNSRSLLLFVEMAEMTVSGRVGRWNDDEVKPPLH